MHYKFKHCAAISHISLKQYPKESSTYPNCMLLLHTIVYVFKYFFLYQNLLTIEFSLSFYTTWIDTKCKYDIRKGRNAYTKVFLINLYLVIFSLNRDLWNSFRIEQSTCTYFGYSWQTRKSHINDITCQSAELKVNSLTHMTHIYDALLTVQML